MDSRLSVTTDAELFYCIDDYTDPWSRPTTVLLVHGFGESGEAWRAWVPHLARRHRVIRIDQRGFGRSTPMPAKFPWTLERWTDDLIEVVSKLSPQGVHLVAAKVGGPVAINAASLRPDLIHSLTLVGAVAVGPDHSASVASMQQHGVRHWCEATMSGRLGADMTSEAVAWWIDLMSATPMSTAIGFLKFVRSLDVTDLLPTLACPVQVIATDSARRPIAETEAWSNLIPRSKLVTVDGPAYHVAAVKPDLCAELTARFLVEVEGHMSTAKSPQRGQETGHPIDQHPSDDRY